MASPTIVGISGSLSKPSRTSSLVSELLSRIASKTDADPKLLELAEIAATIFAVHSPGNVSEPARAILSQIESADLLVVGTPVYRASYTGAIKHLFDLVDHRAFSGKPVVLAATGGSLLHGLVIEHQLRPLFGFLNALTLPTSVYAVEGDFADNKVTNPSIAARVERAASEAAAALKNRPIEERLISRSAFQAAG